MLKAKEVDGDITKFDYDAFNVLNQIIKPNADELDFNFDMLGRLRKYETSNRESAFAMDGTKRLGDFEDKTDEWRRYHWCKQHLLGYKDDSDTYYFLTEPDGSVEVIFTHAGTTVNRLEYDFLGKIRNQTTTPQVELLWRGKFFLSDADLYLWTNRTYLPLLGCSFTNLTIPYPINTPFIYGYSELYDTDHGDECAYWKARELHWVESAANWLMNAISNDCGPGTWGWTYVPPSGGRSLGEIYSDWILNALYYSTLWEIYCAPHGPYQLALDYPYYA